MLWPQRQSWAVVSTENAQSISYSGSGGRLKGRSRKEQQPTRGQLNGTVRQFKPYSETTTSKTLKAE
jgi:hypothetical protein